MAEESSLDCQVKEESPLLRSYRSHGPAIYDNLDTNTTPGFSDENCDSGARAHWDGILRLASSIEHGTVTASLALRELGRIERPLFTMKTYQCIVCGFIYDESAGMPADWSRPDCDVARADVEMVELES